MAGTFNIKQNDTLPVIEEQLELGGVPIDITGSTVRFHLRAPDNSTKVNSAATIVTPDKGIVKYVWQASDTDTIGDYLREWEVTFGDGGILTFPNDTVGFPVIITDDIA